MNSPGGQSFRQKGGVFCIGLIVIAAITYIDTVTNPDLALIPFYLLPVVTLTLVLGPGMGILSAGFAACSWLFAERFGGSHPTHPAVPYWNALMNLAIFSGFPSWWRRSGGMRLCSGGIRSGSRSKIRRFWNSQKQNRIFAPWSLMTCERRWRPFVKALL